MIQAATFHPTCFSRSLAEEIFGDDFEVWEYTDRWCRTHRGLVKFGDVSVDFYIRLISQLEQAANTSTVLLKRIDHLHTLCLVPLPHSNRRSVAIRVLRTDSDDLLDVVQRAASSAVAERQRTEETRRRLAESNSLLAAWTTRISQGDAELKWLHGLSVNSELSETGNDPLCVANRILPEMCRLVRARTVIFVPATDDETLAEERLTTWQTGDERVPESVCEKLISEFGEQPDKPAVVKNFPAPQFQTPTFAGVLSCIVKTVNRDGQRVGWLLAVNKDLQHLVSASAFNVRQQELDRQCLFGSFESGLVEAASIAFSAHARNSGLLKEREELVRGAFRSLVNAIDAKDSYTCGHSDRVAEYAREIAMTMGLDETFCEQIYITGLLHDVGKIGVPDSVLQKPGRLTDEEFDEIRKHPVIGHEILRHLSDFDYVLPGVLHHHESVDGTGYPHGLAGEEIPLMARILAVADAYDAMTSDRPYRSGMPTEKAEAIIADGAGQQWDANCVAAFQQCMKSDRFSTPHELDPARLTIQAG